MQQRLAKIRESRRKEAEKLMQGNNFSFMKPAMALGGVGEQEGGVGEQEGGEQQKDEGCVQGEQEVSPPQREEQQDKVGGAAQVERQTMSTGAPMLPQPPADWENLEPKSAAAPSAPPVHRRYQTAEQYPNIDEPVEDLTSKTANADGTVTLTTKLPNGSTVSTNADGSTVKVSADGLTTDTATPDGTITTVVLQEGAKGFDGSSRTTITRPDGTSTTLHTGRDHVPGGELHTGRDHVPGGELHQVQQQQQQQQQQQEEEEQQQQQEQQQQEEPALDPLQRRKDRIRNMRRQESNELANSTTNFSFKKQLKKPKNLGQSLAL
jgi:hypothetical protein